VPLWPALIANASVALTFVFIPALVPPLVDHYDVSLAVGGWSLTAINIPFAIIAFWLGLRGIGVRLGLLAGVGTMAVVNTLAPLAPDYTWYLISRLGAGVGMALTFAGAYTLVAAGDNVPRRAALYGAMIPAVSLVIPLAGVLTDAFGWEASHLALGALPAATFVALVALPWESPGHTPRTELRFGFSAQAWMGLGSVLLWAGAVSSIWVFIGSYAEDVLYGGDSDGVATLTGFGLAINGLLGAVAAALASRLSGRHRPWAGVAAFVATMLIAVAFVNTSNVAQYLFFVGIWGFVYWISYPVYQGMLSESVDPTARGRVLTFFQVPFSIGLGMGPVLGGLVLGDEDYGALAAFTVAALFLALGAFVLAWGARLRHPEAVAASS
jgi:predicted MFS family arabinose efflux permease